MVEKFDYNKLRVSYLSFVNLAENSGPAVNELEFVLNLQLNCRENSQIIMPYIDQDFCRNNGLYRVVTFLPSLSKFRILYYILVRTVFFVRIVLSIKKFKPVLLIVNVSVFVCILIVSPDSKRI